MSIVLVAYGFFVGMFLTSAVFSYLHNRFVREMTKHAMQNEGLSVELGRLGGLREERLAVVNYLRLFKYHALANEIENGNHCG